MTDLALTANIDVLESHILKMAQTDLKTTHAMSGGMYARTIFIAARTVLTGATHKTDHLNIIDGDITVTADGAMKRFTGHHVLPTKAGERRAGYAHTDTWWTTICKTDKELLADIECELVEEADRLQSNQLLSNGKPVDILGE